MAAISYALSFGVDGFKQSDFTKGTSAPGAGDIEIRINTTDQNAVATKVKQIIIALEAFERAVEGDAMFGSDWGV